MSRSQVALALVQALACGLLQQQALGQGLERPEPVLESATMLEPAQVSAQAPELERAQVSSQVLALVSAQAPERAQVSMWRPS